MKERLFDLICVGRCMVDLYCDQIGSAIRDGQSLSMYVGGCPTNVAVGAARQGLRVAMLTRVGEDATGEFVVETLRREGIDTSHVRRDADARTPMVVAGIEPPSRFPLTWYRERTADLRVGVEDFDDSFVGSASAILISGMSLSTPPSARMVEALAAAAVRVGTRIIYDVDFRPVLWVRDGAPVPTDEVARVLQSLLPHVDLLVGTEEEYRALMGVDDAAEALEQAHQAIPGTAIMKLGAQGARIVPRSGDALAVNGFPVRVFNTLGAGDAFISGFLGGWLRGEPLEECGRRANSSGAIVVTRHGCSPAMPYERETRRFFAETLPAGRSPQDDEGLDRLHVIGARRPVASPLLVLAIDHRLWFEELAGAGDPRIGAFKRLAVEAVLERMRGEGLLARAGFLLDAQYAGEALLGEVARMDVWVAEPLEVAGSAPVQVLGGDPALTIRGRPRDRVVKLLVLGGLGERDDAWQAGVVRQVQTACEAYGRDLLVEVLRRDDRGAVDVVDVVEGLRRAGVSPRWWKIPLPTTDELWARTRTALEDPLTGGERHVLFLGGGESHDEVLRRFARVAEDPMAQGFAVGRSVFGAPFRTYLAGGHRDAVSRAVADGFMRIVEGWMRASPRV